MQACGDAVTQEGDPRCVGGDLEHGERLVRLLDLRGPVERQSPGGFGLGGCVRAALEGEREDEEEGRGAHR